MSEPTGVPAWLALVRMALQAATVLAIFLYPLLPADERQKHAKAVEKLEDRLDRIRISLPLLLQGTARFLQDAFGRLYGGPVRVIFASTSLTLIYVLFVGLLNWNWIVGTSAYSTEKLALDQSVDPRLKYTEADINRANEYIIIGPKESARSEPRWKGGISDEIRKSFKEQHSRWFANLKKMDHAREIAFLTIFLGYSWDSGPLWSSHAYPVDTQAYHS
jgi:hypothetical protein